VSNSHLTEGDSLQRPARGLRRVEQPAAGSGVGDGRQGGLKDDRVDVLELRAEIDELERSARDERDELRATLHRVLSRPTSLATSGVQMCLGCLAKV